jgi:protein tyrosine phosphatase
MSLSSRNPDFTFAAMSPEKQELNLDHEFQRLRQIDHEVMRGGSFSVALCDRNRDKNRYSDVLPFDINVYPSSPHYINGTLITRDILAPHCVPPHEFIATQAPVAHGFEEWWETVAESNARLIVMLTQETENGITKADRYWAAPNLPLTLETGSVILKEETVIGPKVVLRQLEYHRRSHPHQPCRVQQVQYIGWPDHGVPDTASGFLAVLHQVQLTQPDHPIFVHCSAGIGRTGTLIAVYYAMCLAAKGKLIDSSIFEIVARLKKARCGMVQKKEQYGFIYSCVAELLKGKSL